MRKEAKELVKDCADLQQQVLEKFATAVLEEVADQIKARDSKIAALEKTVATFISCMYRELGKTATEQLLDTLYPPGQQPQPEPQRGRSDG